MVLTFYRNQYSINDASAKVNSRCDYYQLQIKTTLTGLFIFLKGSNYQWFLCIYLIITSVISYNNFKKSQPYYNSKISLIYIISTFLFFWGNFCLLVSKMLDATDFFGGALQLYFLGVPISIALIIFG
jgi:hypothetical protein